MQKKEHVLWGSWTSKIWGGTGRGCGGAQACHQRSLASAGLASDLSLYLSVLLWTFQLYRTQTSVSMPSCLSISRPPSLLQALDMASQCPPPTLTVPRTGILTERMGPRQRATNESMCESPRWGPQLPKLSGPSRSIKGTGDQVWLARPMLGCRPLSLKPWIWDWRIGSPSINCSWSMIQPKLQHWLPEIIPE